MERQIRIRNKTLDVQITLWKLLPVIFMVLLFLMSATLAGGSAGGGNAPAWD